MAGSRKRGLIDMADETPNATTPPTAPIPPELSNVPDVAPPPAPPATRKELVAALDRAVACIKEAQDLQDKFGFAVMQLQDPATSKPETKILFLPKGLATLARDV